MHKDMTLMRQRHPGWIWNRSDTHVLLGVPQSLEGHKAVVEPGNSFSPGVGTFGVSVWLFDRRLGKLVAAEELPTSAFAWQFEPGGVPILTCMWQAGSFTVRSELFTEGDWRQGDIGTFMTVAVSPAPGEPPAECSLYIVLRSFGAAGGPVHRVEYDACEQAVRVNGGLAAFCQVAPDAFGALSYQADGSDIGERLRLGQLPPAQSAADDSGWASAAVEYRFAAGSKPPALRFQFPHHLGHPNRNLAASLAARNDTARLDDLRSAFIQRWRAHIGSVELTTPDERFNQAFYCQLAHMWAATVYSSVRIANVSYPIWWLRDGVYVLNALDKGGLHDFARDACLELAPRLVFGGFGCEGDGPGEGIWALGEHYLLTRDAEYLRQVYGGIIRRADLLVRMLHTAEPIRMFTEFGTPEAIASPFFDLVCMASQDGMIRGRMDWHFPTFWVNAHACSGLARAADLADVMGDRATAGRFRAEADALRARLAAVAPAEFGKNERDVTGVVWPTRALTGDEPGVRAAFDAFWTGTRCPGGMHAPEKLWTYFEAGQAHNYLFLGQRERTWVSLEHFLTRHAAPGLYTYHEAAGDENSFGLWQRCRGWDRIPFVTPHGWTAAELFLLMRDCMLHESADGASLVIGAGVPREWVASGKPVGIANAPSHFGKVSWRLEGGKLTVRTERRVGTEHPAPGERPAPGAYIIDLPGVELLPADGCTASRNATGQWVVRTDEAEFQCRVR